MITTLKDIELIKYQGLWHGLKTENFMKALNVGTLFGRTLQRYWKDGGVVLDCEREKYEKSFWMKGWSATRDKNYAMAWG